MSYNYAAVERAVFGALDQNYSLKTPDAVEVFIQKAALIP